LVVSASSSLSFRYHMYGSNVEKLAVLVRIVGSGREDMVFEEEGDKGNQWLSASVDLSSYRGSELEVSFLGVRGLSWRGDIAIDNVTLSHGPMRTKAPLRSVTFRYYRLRPTGLRSGQANSVQLSEVRFKNDAAFVSFSNAVAINPGGSNPYGMGPAMGIDGKVQTKWLDKQKGPLVIDFGTGTQASHFRFTTANDAEERDPVTWSIEGSNDTADWTVLQDQSIAYSTPTARGATTPWFAFE